MLAGIRTSLQRASLTRNFSTSSTLRKTLYVGNLPWTIKDEDLKANFQDFGEVSSARVVTDKLSGRSRGFGFVDLVEDSAADVAAEEMNGKELDGRALTVNVSIPREPGSYDNNRRERSSYGSDRGGYGQRYNDRGEDRRGGGGGYGRRDDRRGGEGRSYESRGRGGSREDY